MYSAQEKLRCSWVLLLVVYVSATVEINLDFLFSSALLLWTLLLIFFNKSPPVPPEAHLVSALNILSPRSVKTTPSFLLLLLPPPHLLLLLLECCIFVSAPLPALSAPEFPLQSSSVVRVRTLVIPEIPDWERQKYFSTSPHISVCIYSKHTTTVFTLQPAK